MKYIKFIFDRIITVLLNVFFYIVGTFVKRDANLWILGSRSGNGFNDNPKYLFLYLAQKTDQRAIWITRKSQICKMLREKKYESYTAWSPKGIYLSIKAKYHVIAVHDKDINPYTSTHAIKLNPWHGFPITAFFSHRLKDKSKLRKFVIENSLGHFLNMICTPGFWIYEKMHQLSISKLFFDTWHEELSLTPERTIKANYPRNDILIDYNYLKDIAIDKELLNVTEMIEEKKKNNTKIICYMPTWRQTSSDRYFYCIYDEKELFELDNFLKSVNAMLVVKAHPLVTNIFELFEKCKNIVGLSPFIDCYPVLAKSDILITDFSSIYHDYLWRNKPLIFYPYDRKLYEKDYTFIYNYDKITPGPKVNSLAELITEIQKVISGQDDYEVARQERRELVYDYEKGSELVVKQLKQLKL